MAETDTGLTEWSANDMMLALPIHTNLRKVGSWLRQHSEFSPEQIDARGINFGDLMARGKERYERHVATYTTLGGLMLGGIGVVTGALVFSDHRSN